MGQRRTRKRRRTLNTCVQFFVTHIAFGCMAFLSTWLHCCLHLGPTELTFNGKTTKKTTAASAVIVKLSEVNIFPPLSHHHRWTDNFFSLHWMGIFSFGVLLHFFLRPPTSCSLRDRVELLLRVLQSAWTRDNGHNKDVRCNVDCDR